MHQCFRLWCSIAIGVREIVDLHSHVCDVALYATNTLAVDAAHFVLLPMSCNRLPTSLVHASGAVLLLELKGTFANGCQIVHFMKIGCPIRVWSFQCHQSPENSLQSFSQNPHKVFQSLPRLLPDAFPQVSPPRCLLPDAFSNVSSSKKPPHRCPFPNNKKRCSGFRACATV